MGRKKGSVAWNKGLKDVQEYNNKGKTYEEIYGLEKAKELKNKLSKSHLGQVAWNKGTIWAIERGRRLGLSNKGKERNNEFRDKLSKIMRGRKLSKETRKKISLFHKGRSSHFKNKTYEEIYGIERTKVLLGNKSRKMKGKNLGRKCAYPKKIFKWSYFYNPLQGKIRLRSSWEFIVAIYLLNKQIDFIYEKERFILNGKTFLPDFYLVKDNKFWEVKGWVKERDKEIFREMKTKYPNINIELISGEKFKKIKMEVKNGVRNLP